MIYFLLFIAVFIITLLAAGRKYTIEQIKARKANEARLAASLEELLAKYKDVIDLEAFKQNLSLDIASLQSRIDAATQQNQTLSNHVNGQINSDTMLWYEGLPNWIPLSQLQK